MSRFFDLYSEFEDGLIREFHRHALWRDFDRLNNERIIGLLLQLGHLSANFVCWYEQAKHGLDSDVGKEVIRAILRDEIPRDAPTHQDNRIADLMRIGVPKERILHTFATACTRRVLRNLNALIRFPQQDYDIRVLVTLRIAGEILVAETYRHVVPELTRRFQMLPEQSRFYYPHFVHDEKHAGGHVGSFDEVLAALIANERDFDVARDTAQRAFDARFAFYDQFVKQEKK